MHLIGRYPRYHELYDRFRGVGSSSAQALLFFSNQDICDLQVLSQLAWFDEFYLENPDVAGLVSKERNYTREDQEFVLAKQREILKAVLPEYARAAGRKSTLLENVNIVTLGACAGIVVGGSTFTMPAIFILGLQEQSSFAQVFVVPLLGAGCKSSKEDTCDQLAKMGTAFANELGKRVGGESDLGESGEIKAKMAELKAQCMKWPDEQGFLDFLTVMVDPRFDRPPEARVSRATGSAFARILGSVFRRYRSRADRRPRPAEPMTAALPIAPGAR